MILEWEKWLSNSIGNTLQLPAEILQSLQDEDITMARNSIE